MQTTLLILSYITKAAGFIAALKAIAGGIEDATQAYVDSPAASAAMAMN